MFTKTDATLSDSFGGSRSHFIAGITAITSIVPISDIRQATLLTSLSNVMVHCRVLGRTSPVGEKDTISGGATVNEK